MTHFKPDQLSFISGMRKHVLQNMELASSADLLVHVVRYIEALAEELKNDKEKELSEDQKAGIQRALMDTPKSISVLHDLIVDQVLNRSQKEDLLFCLAKLVDDALELGFFHGLDRKSLKSRDGLMQGGKSGGKKGGKTRAKKTLTWKTRVDSEIVRIRSEQPQDGPRMSYEKLADAILFAWPDTDPPGHQSVTKHISAFDKKDRAAKGNEAASIRSEGGSST